MSKAKLKKYLSSLERDHLMSLMLEMYDARKSVREYLDFCADPDEEKARENALKVLRRNYFTTQNRCRKSFSVKGGNDIVADFGSLNPSPENMGLLLTAHVEMAMEYLLRRGIIRETAWRSMVGLFDKASSYSAAYGLDGILGHRLGEVMKRGSRAPGWLGIDRMMKEKWDENRMGKDEGKGK